MDQPTINNPSLNEGKNPKEESAPPLEMPPDISAPEPMGGQPGKEATSQSNSGSSNNPSNLSPLSGPKKPIFPLILIIFLIAVLITGTLFFAAWKGWIKLGGLFQGTSTPTPTVSPKISPAISAILPSTSPSSTSTPQTTTNVNDQTRKADLQKISEALNAYYQARSQYPISSTVIKTSDSSSVLAQALVPTHLEKLPDDPLAPQYYYGYKSEDGKNFELTAVLEDKTDSQGVTVGNYHIYKLNGATVE